MNYAQEYKDLVEYGIPKRIASRIVACAIINKKPTRYVWGAIKRIRRAGYTFSEALENLEFSQVEKRATRSKFAPWGVEWAAGRDYDQIVRVDIKLDIELELKKAKMLETFRAYLAGSKAAERKLYRAGIAAVLLRRQYLALTS